MMHKYRRFVIGLILTVGLLMPFAILAQEQLWLQFAHPNNPHLTWTNPPVNMTIPALFNDLDAVEGFHRGEHVLPTLRAGLDS